MPQKKDAQIVVGIEPAFKDLINKVDGGNTSQYIRDLIVTDLYNRGLITTDVLVKVIVGGSSSKASDNTNGAEASKAAG